MGHGGQEVDPAGEAFPSDPAFSEQDSTEDTGEGCRSDMPVV